MFPKMAMIKREVRKNVFESLWARGMLGVQFTVIGPRFAGLPTSMMATPMIFGTR